MKATIAAALFVLVAGTPVLGQLPPVNTFEVVGKITHVDNDNDFFVITIQEAPFYDIVVVCDVDVRPGCADLDVGKEAIVKGHMGVVGAACSGREYFYNPLVPDELWQCDGLVCEQL